MNIITRIKELDIYLVSFFDQDTVHKYSILSKQTNQLATNHVLFKILKKYHETSHGQDNVLNWGIITDNPYVLDWHDKLGYNFNNAFVLIDLAIVHSSTKILDWFYQRDMFDYTLFALQQAVYDGEVETIDWFYVHSLEKSYLDKLLQDHEDIINNGHVHLKLLKILTWMYDKNYPIKLNPNKISKRIAKGSVELLKWLLDHQLIDKFTFSSGRFWFFMGNLTIEKQLETLNLLKELDYHFGEDDFPTLLDGPVEVLEWYVTNNPHIRRLYIFTSAALHNKISIMKWTGIGKDHPDFDPTNNDYIIKHAIRNHHFGVIEWYSENIIFGKKILDLMYKEFSSMTKLTAEKIMQNEKYFDKYNYSHKSINQFWISDIIASGNLPILEYLLSELSPKIVIHVYTNDILPCISNGDIDMLKWFEKHLSNNPNTRKGKKSVQILYRENIDDFSDIIDSAAYDGHLETIKWAKHFFSHKFGYKYAIDNAARNGHVHVLNWFNKLFRKPSEFKYSDKICDKITFAKGLQIFKWFESSGHPLKYSNNLIEYAIYHKKIHILQWLKDNNYPMSFNARSIYYACISFSEVLQWLKDNGIIKILSRETTTNLITFKIILSQPFIKSQKSNVVYKIDNLPIYTYPTINICSVIENNVPGSETNIPGIESNIPGTESNIPGTESKILEIRYEHDKIHIVSTARMYDGVGIYHSLHWFERWCKLSK